MLKILDGRGGCGIDLDLVKALVKPYCDGGCYEGLPGAVTRPGKGGFVISYRFKDLLKITGIGLSEDLLTEPHRVIPILAVIARGLLDYLFKSLRVPVLKQV